MQKVSTEFRWSGKSSLLFTTMPTSTIQSTTQTRPDQEKVRILSKVILRTQRPPVLFPSMLISKAGGEVPSSEDRKGMRILQSDFPDSVSEGDNLLRRIWKAHYRVVRRKGKAPAKRVIRQEMICHGCDRSFIGEADRKLRSHDCMLYRVKGAFRKCGTEFVGNKSRKFCDGCKRRESIQNRDSVIKSLAMTTNVCGICFESIDPIGFSSQLAWRRVARRALKTP